MKERISLMGNPNMDRDWASTKGANGEMEIVNFLTWAKTEGRFKKHFDAQGNPITDSILLAQQDRLENWRLLQELAGITNKDREAQKLAKAGTAA
jgi:pyruvate ferredoxin oxidoreductase beta subunit